MNLKQLLYIFTITTIFIVGYSSSLPLCDLTWSYDLFCTVIITIYILKQTYLVLYTEFLAGRLCLRFETDWLATNLKS